MRGLFGNHPVPHVDDLVERARKFIPGVWLIGSLLAALFLVYFLASDRNATPRTWLIAIVIFVAGAIFSRWFCRWCASRVTSEIWAHRPLQLAALYVLPEYIALLPVPIIAAIVNPIRVFNGGGVMFPFILFPLVVGFSYCSQKFSVGNEPSCANCGYPRPAEQDDPKTVCPECGNAWWLEGRFTKGRIVHPTHWATASIVIFLLAVILPSFIFMKLFGGPRGAVRFAPTSSLVSSLSTQEGGYSFRNWHELAHRTLSTDQVHRLASTLLVRLSANSNDQDAIRGIGVILQQRSISDNDLRDIINAYVKLNVRLTANSSRQLCMEIRYAQQSWAILSLLSSEDVRFYISFPIDDLGPQAQRIFPPGSGNKVGYTAIPSRREVCGVSLDHIPDVIHLPVLVVSLHSPVPLNEATVNPDGSLTPPVGTTWSRTIIIEKAVNLMGPPAN